MPILKISIFRGSLVNKVTMLVFGLMMAAASGIAIEYRLRIDQSEMVDRQTALEDLNRDINASYELLVQEKSSIQQHMSDE
jgi:hypothetical protein